MLTEMLILLVLIVLNAFFAASEIALISLNDNKIKAMADEGHKKAVLLRNLLSEPSRFLATIKLELPWLDSWQAHLQRKVLLADWRVICMPPRFRCR